MSILTILSDLSINSIFSNEKGGSPKLNNTRRIIYLSGGSRVDPHLATMCSQEYKTCILFRCPTMAPEKLLHYLIWVCLFPLRTAKAWSRLKAIVRENTHTDMRLHTKQRTKHGNPSHLHSIVSWVHTLLGQRTKNNSQLCQLSTLVNMCQLSSIV